VVMQARAVSEGSRNSVF